MAGNKWALASLASIPLIMTLGNSMLIPLLPQFAKQLKVSSFEASMLITIYGVVAILFIPVAGYLSDHWGRKAVIVPSLLLAGAGAALSGVAAWLWHGGSAYWIILLGRLIQGIGAAGAFPIVISFVGDLYKDQQEVSKNLGIIETSNTFGKVLSPILGAALGAVLWYLPLLIIAPLCVLSTLAVIFGVKTPRKKAAARPLKQVLHSVKDILKEKGRWLYALFAIGGICMFLLFGVLSYLSEQLEVKHDLHGVVKGLVLAIPLAALCLASYVTGKKIGKNKKVMKWCSVVGMLLATVSLFGIGLFNQIYFVIGCLIISGSGIGAVLPCMDSMITEGIPKDIRGTVTSLYNSMRFIGVSLGPPAVSLLMMTSHRVMFFIIAGVSLAAVLLVLFAVRPGAKRKGRGSLPPHPAPL